jgi:hypothetical protein
MNKNNGVTVTLPDNGMCALVKKIDGRYEIDTGRIEGKDIFLSPWVKTADRLPTSKDENGFGVVVAYNPELGGNEEFGYGACIRAWCVSLNPEQWPYWMPIPPLPEDEE